VEFNNWVHLVIGILTLLGWFKLWMIGVFGVYACCPLFVDILSESSTTKLYLKLINKDQSGIQYGSLWMKWNFFFVSVLSIRSCLPFFSCCFSTQSLGGSIRSDHHYLLRKNKWFRGCVLIRYRWIRKITLDERATNDNSYYVKV
jgi:hypothetical protein